ncbi:MAG: phosphoribosylformylglycinamidine cyclo-ligase [Thermoleophilia bacterium]
MTEPLSYRDSGVDLDAARQHTEAIAGLVHGGVTGFAGGIPMPAMRDGVLLACTDGIGTKLLLAQELDRMDGLGQDLVAMCVNDLVCSGARPLAFLDYLAVGRLDPERAAALVGSIAQACRASGCVLLGGETAEMPGLYAPGHFDLAGFAVGAVERDEMLGPHRVQVGDLVIGIPSSGIHSNGFSLVRALINDGALVPNSDLLLAPTRLYVSEVLGLMAAGVQVHAAAHITGGGLPENLPRAVPQGMRAVLDPRTWSVGPAIEAVLAGGRVAADEAWRTFNMGVGMCLVVAAEAQDAVVAAIPDAKLIGWIEPGEAGLRFV